jgi:hypothetical protein
MMSGPTLSPVALLCATWDPSQLGNCMLHLNEQLRHETLEGSTCSYRLGKPSCAQGRTCHWLMPVDNPSCTVRKFAVGKFHIKGRSEAFSGSVQGRSGRQVEQLAHFNCRVQA